MLQRTNTPLITAKDLIWNAMSEARNIQVVSIAADDSTVTYRLSFDLVFDRKQWKQIAEHATSHGNKIRSFIANKARFGLRIFFGDDDGDSAAGNGHAGIEHKGQTQ
jgi:hypothetical protein